jgi:Tfp pilus assembly protein PilF
MDHEGRAATSTAGIADLALRTGLQYAVSGLLEDAETWLRLALAIEPQHPSALTSLGDVLRRQGRLGEAMPPLETAVELAPDMAEAHLNLGVARCESGLLEEAALSLSAAVRLDPCDPRAHNNLGLLHKAQGQLEQAIASLNEAIRLAPDFREARVNRALAFLLAGRFEEGWSEYEWRHTEAPLPAHPLARYLCAGGSLAHKSVTLRCEQGLGDTIQFVRYAAILHGMGAHITVACPAEALPLVRCALGVAEAVALEEPPRQCDFSVPLLSLPLILHPRSATIPAPIPYFQLDPRRVDAWHRRIGHAGRLRVGLVWGGNPNAAQDRTRSLEFRELAPILQNSAAQVFSLQCGPRAADLAACPDAAAVIDLAPEIHDLVDTAAAMENLDLVISVDTMPAHLAGALGRPVWLLLPCVPDWRWLMERSTTPWYPTMRLFRQPSPGNWRSVIAQVTAELRHLSSYP